MWRRLTGLAVVALCAPLQPGGCDCEPEAGKPGHEQTTMVSDSDPSHGLKDAAPMGDPSLPGVEHPDPMLDRQLRSVLAERGTDYVPRTHHLRSDGSPRYVNRLIRETSPYLLQHAHNPVNFFAWGPTALSRARTEGKPILLSIGDSTCHWCHVMERESFEDEQIARYLNEHYISIKVDREERPDLDDVYMSAVMMLTSAFAEPLTQQPLGAARMLAALDRYLDVTREVVVMRSAVGDGGALLAALRSAYLPNRMALVVSEGEQAPLVQRLPWLADKVLLDGQATAYVCEHGRCQLPTTDAGTLSQQLAYCAALDYKPTPLSSQ